MATPGVSEELLSNAPLTAEPSSLARVRSWAMRELAASVLPRSLFFAHGSRRKENRRVALTFDDGPDLMTLQYLDALDWLGVRATFFFVGENARNAPKTVAEVVRRGHEIGGHGWSHTPFPALEAHELLAELARTQAVLPAPADGPKMVRPPRGSLSARTLFQVRAAGYVTVLWSLDSDDCRTRDPLEIERRVSPFGVRPGEVVLMHEMQPWTLRALPAVVRGLRAGGFDLVTVGQLMRDE
jgi:peptidoglycan/xylan/chitin deacetylase (PgdA/CDA1 family)